MHRWVGGADCTGGWVARVAPVGVGRGLHRWVWGADCTDYARVYGAANTAGTLLGDWQAPSPIDRVLGATQAETEAKGNASKGGDRTLGQDIAYESDGHAWDHAQDGDFGDISDLDDLGDHLDGVINNPADSKELGGGRQAWLGHDGTVVIHNPNGPSTAFNPDSQGESSQDYWDFDL